ncbi:tudor domain-containing protein 10-like isoform X2 [Heptranchias perlo]|uniref:tudor domain-containing protein 10-like isoform X2 n=1 Tax=Heptranchias perlo TaxID=212740 RepID=UPI003559DAFF
MERDAMEGLRKPLEKMRMAKNESGDKQQARRVFCLEGTPNKRSESRKTTGLIKNEVYIGNLPSEMIEDQIMQLFAAYEPVKVRKVVSGLKCYAFVDVGDAENVALAVSHLNNTFYSGRRLVVRDLAESRSSERPTEMELPALEKVDKDSSSQSSEESQFVSRPIKDGSQSSNAVPLEMSYAFVDVGDAENVALAVSHLNNTFYSGRRLVVRDLAESRSSERPTEMELPALEKIDKDSNSQSSEGTEFQFVSRPIKDGSQTSYAVPLEMRSLTLVQMLTSCFKDIGWLAESTKVHGEVGLMVMDTFPRVPYFWAINLTPETYVKMCQLFNALSVVTQEQPFLKKSNVQRGQRCMAEFPGEGGEWNRCWIVDVVESRVILFYVDSGSTACVPTTSVKSLDNDEFWTVPPLVQPFVLQQGVMGNRKMDGTILKGRVVGFHEAEPHILKFCITHED